MHCRLLMWNAPLAPIRRESVTARLRTAEGTFVSTACRKCAPIVSEFKVGPKSDFETGKLQMQGCTAKSKNSVFLPLGGRGRSTWSPHPVQVTATQQVGVKP